MGKVQLPPEEAPHASMGTLKLGQTEKKILEGKSSSGKHQNAQPQC